MKMKIKAVALLLLATSAQASPFPSPTDPGGDLNIAQVVLSGDAGLLVWDHFTNTELLPTALVSRGFAANSPRLDHIRVLLQCPLIVRESLFPTEFLDLNPANAGVLTLTLGDYPEYRPIRIRDPTPLFVSHGRSKPVDDWEPCLAALAAAFAIPKFDPLMHIKTLRLVSGPDTFEPEVVAHFENLVNVRAEAGNPLRIEADVRFLKLLTAVEAGSFTALTILPGPLHRQEFIAFFDKHGPFLKTISLPQDYPRSPSFRTDAPYNPANEIEGGRIACETILDKSTAVETLTLPYVTKDEFPSTLRHLTVVEVTPYSEPFPHAACTQHLESLTVEVDSSVGGLTAIVNCLKRSPNLERLVVEFSSLQDVPDLAAGPYQEYLGHVALSRSIVHATIPPLWVTDSEQAVSIPATFPHLKHLQARARQVTAAFLSRFPALDHLSLMVDIDLGGNQERVAHLANLVGDADPPVEGPGITRLDVSSDGAPEYVQFMCDLAASRNVFRFVEHLVVEELLYGSTAIAVSQCFLDATHRPLQTINEVPVEELRAKFQRLAEVRNPPVSQSVLHPESF